MTIAANQKKCLTLKYKEHKHEEKRSVTHTIERMIIKARLWLTWKPRGIGLTSTAARLQEEVLKKNLGYSKTDIVTAIGSQE